MVTLEEVKSWFADVEGSRVTMRRGTSEDSFRVRYRKVFLLNKKVSQMIVWDDGTMGLKLRCGGEDIYLFIRRE